MAEQRQNNGSKRRGSFRKNVVMKKYSVLCRNSYGEDICHVVEAETESVAATMVPKGLEVVTVEEEER